MKFDKYYISEAIKKNLKGLGFYRPTDIQFKAIPSILKGEDVLAIAQTGTGKTAAFAIPVIDTIHRLKTSKRSLGIKCIVMVPTRELSIQIGDVFATLARHTKVKSMALIGGVDQESQVKRLLAGVDVLITTPGRMFDLIHQGYIDVTGVEQFVLDEADQMLDLGFIKDIEFIKTKLKRKHQTLFFSATINKKIKKLAFSQVKKSAIRIQISPDDPVTKNVTHFVVSVAMDDKRFFLENFIKENPGKKVIVFVRTRVRAERVVKAMERVEIKTIAIHGEKDQKARLEAMEKFKEGQSDILIATDVSARGIDIPNVDFVINYDLPEVAENYVHRIGRTGRGFNKGEAISFCSEREKELLSDIEKFIGRKIDHLSLSKKQYSDIVKPDPDELSIDEMIKEQEEWDYNKNKKRKKRRKK